MGYEIKNNKVIKITKMNITGNIVPISWFEHLTFKSGKPHLPAIMILSDIIYWYRAQETREQDGTVVEYKQKFQADMLQKQYKEWMKLYGFGRAQTKSAVDYLQKEEYINREFRDVERNGEIFQNRMYVEPKPEKIEKITYGRFQDKNPPGQMKITTTPVQNEEGVISNRGEFSDENNQDISSKKGGGHSKPNSTHNSTKTTSKTTTDYFNKNNKNARTPEKSSKYSLPDPNEIKQSIEQLNNRVIKYYEAHFYKKPSSTIATYLNKLDSEVACHAINFAGENSYDPPQIIKILKNLLENNIETIDGFYEHVNKFQNKKENNESNSTNTTNTELEELYQAGYR